MTHEHQSWRDWTTAPALSPPASDTIHVLAFPLAPLYGRLDVLETLLSADERMRAARFVRAADRRRYVVAHAMMREILSSAVGCAPLDLVFERNRWGKPRLAGDIHEVQFNLAHSADLAMLAVSAERPVGIDLEHHHERADWRMIAQQTLSPADCRAIDALSPAMQLAAFYASWTRQEAALKARGEGLASSAASLASHDPRWWTNDLPAGPGVAATLASEIPRPRIQLHRWVSN
jgi:4'-phosphopantetheinyl transferase